MLVSTAYKLSPWPSECWPAGDWPYLGAPVDGWAADVFGPRCVCELGAAPGFAAAGVASH